MRLCPFCKSALPAGAESCAQCGARYGYDPNRPMHPLVRLGFLAAGALIAVEAVRIAVAPEWSYAAAFLLAAVLVLGTRRQLRKHWWRRT